MSNQEYKLLTVEELSKAIKLSKSQIYKLIRNKKIPYTKISGKYLFQESNIINWITTHSHTPNA